MSNLIRKFLDLFYPIVSKIFDKTTYYYAACGVGNLILSWFLFFLFYQYVFEKKLWYIQKTDFVFTPYTLSAFSCFIVSFVLGFILMKFVVFTESALKGRIQLFRYGLSAMVTSGANWILLKGLVELLEFFPSIANVISTCIVVVISYLIQRNFTFK